MSWFYRTIKHAQQQSTDILMQVVRGSMDNMQAVSALQQMNDPQVCGNITALINNPSTISAFPNAMMSLSNISSALNCGNQNMQQQNSYNNTQTPIGAPPAQQEQPAGEAGSINNA